MATPQGPHKYRYGRLNLQFPKEALAPDGSTLRYRYRGYANGVELDQLVNCVIPRSPTAVQMMNNRLGVHGKADLRGGRSSDGGYTINESV